jgi:hypothetical protein
VGASAQEGDSMYFVRYHPIKEKLRDRAVSDREALPYLLLLYALGVVDSLFAGGGPYSLWGRLIGEFLGLTNLVGVVYAYYQNGGKVGHDLFVKIFIFYWLLTVRFTLAGAAILVPLAIFKPDLILALREGLIAEPLPWTSGGI